MRVLGTIVVGLIFVVTFIGVLLAHAVLGFPQDTEAIVQLTRSADVRGHILRAVESEVLDDLSTIPEPGLRQVVRAKVETSIDSLLEDEWFYGAVGDAHRALVAYVVSDDRTVVVDLAPLKENLAKFARSTVTAAVEQCRKMGEDCASAAQLDEGMRRFEAEMQRMLAEVPDQASLERLAEWTDTDLTGDRRLEELRADLATAQTVRWASLGGLVILLGLIALINMGSLARILVNLGVVLLVAGGLYLLVAHSGGDALRAEVEKELRQPETGRDGEAYDVGVEIGRTLGPAAATALATWSNPYAYLALAGGVLMLVGGVGLHSRHRDEVQTATG